MQTAKPTKRFNQAFILLVLFVAPAAVFYFLIYAGVHKVNRLKFYGPKIVELKMVRGSEIADTTYHEIPSFSLYRLTLSGTPKFVSDSLAGKIYLAHFLDRSLMQDIPKEIVYACSEILPAFPELYWVTFWEKAEDYSPVITLPSTRTKKLAGADDHWIELAAPDSLVQKIKSEGYFKVDSAETEKIDPASVALIDKEGRIRSYFNPVKQADISNIKKEILLLYKEYELAYKTHRFIRFN
jgi:hypothetical protein